MTVEGESLVHRESNEIQNRRCVLRLRLTSTELAFADEPVDGDWGCRLLFCGARGSLDGAAFNRASRAPIAPRLAAPPNPGWETEAETLRRDAIEAWQAQRSGRR